MATSMPTVLLRLPEHHVEQTPQIGASQVPSFEEGPLIHLEPQKDHLQEDFGCSLQAAAIEFEKLREPEEAKLKGGYFSNASLVFQLWLKDIQMYVLGCHLPVRSHPVGKGLHLRACTAQG